MSALTYFVFFDASRLDPSKRDAARDAAYAALSELVDPGGRYIWRYDCGGGWALSLREVHRRGDQIECIFTPFQRGEGDLVVSEENLKRFLKVGLFKAAVEKSPDPEHATLAEVQKATRAWRGVIWYRSAPAPSSP